MRRANQKLAGKRERRGLRNRDNYKSFLENKEAYLEDIKERIDRLTVLAKQGYMAEAIILASCYLGALSYFRYLPPPRQDRKTYIRFLLQYGGDKDLAKVSLPILRRTLDSVQGTQTTRLLARVKASEDKKKFLSVQTILRNFKKDFPDPIQLITVVQKATLAGLFYENVRSLGVHQGRSLITNRSSIEVGGICITGYRVIGWLNTSFQNVRPYLQRTHRWIRFGKYA